MNNENKITEERQDSLSEEFKRKRNRNSPDPFEKSKITKRSPAKTNNKQEKPEMDEVKTMFAEIMKEIKRINENQDKHNEKMEILQKENNDMKKQIAQLNERINILERESKRNNLVISGLKVNRENNNELKEEIETFIERELGVQMNLKGARKIGNATHLIEVERMDDKITILKNKSKLRTLKGDVIYINKELTNAEKEIQKKIKEKGMEEKKKGSTIKIGYQKLWINGVEWKWNGETQQLDDTKSKTDKVTKN